MSEEKNENMSWLLNKNPSAYALLLFLTDNMSGHNAVMCSYRALQDRFKWSRQTIYDMVNFLKDNGYIYIYKNGMSNVYVLEDKLVWDSWKNNMKFCKFSANVIVSYEEQPKDRIAERHRDTVKEGTHEKA